MGESKKHSTRISETSTRYLNKAKDLTPLYENIQKEKKTEVRRTNESNDFNTSDKRQRRSRSLDKKIVSQEIISKDNKEKNIRDKLNTTERDPNLKKSNQNNKLNDKNKLTKERISHRDTKKYRENINTNDRNTNTVTTKQQNCPDDQNTLQRHTVSNTKENNSSAIRKKSNSYEIKDNKQSQVNLKHDKRHKRNEYILNYDDKNGTFSSMNKVKHNHSKSSDKIKSNSSRKKHSTVNKNEGKNNEKHPLRK